MFRIQLFLLLGFQAFGVFAYGQAFEDYVVQTDQCAVYENQGGKWAKLPKLPILKGTRVKAKSVAGRDTFKYVWDGKKYLLTALSCLSAGKVDASVVGTKTTASKTSKLKAYPFWVSAGFLGYQETVKLNGSDASVVDTKTNQMAFQLLLGSQFRIGQKFLGEWGIGGFFGQSKVTSSVYESSNSAAFGPILQPGILFFPSGDGFSLGLQVPLIYRMANWPDASTTTPSYLFEAKNQFLIGPSLDLRMTWNSWAVSGAGGILLPTQGVHYGIKLIRKL